MTHMKRAIASLLSALTFGLPAFAATEVKKETQNTETLSEELRRGFYSRINALAYGVYNELDDSSLNPGNVMEIPRRQAEFHFRPDFNLNFRRVELNLKPRFQYAWRDYDDGVRSGESENESQSYVNEWFFRFRLTDKFFAMYGRENLQWGPSQLLSPSNPFNPDNGRNNPRLEVEGLDYGRFIWVPSSSWTVSAIANTDEGRLQKNDPFSQQTTPFRKSYALKLDYTGEDHYFSLIPSYREAGDFQLSSFGGWSLANSIRPDAGNIARAACTPSISSYCGEEEYRLGFFGGWNASDALLLYAEGSGSDNDTNGRDDYELLAGGAYTLQAGPTFTLEYFHNNNGCVLDRIDQCLVSGQADPRDLLMRRRYVMFQYLDTEIVNNLNLSLRLVHNLDDDSTRAIGIIEYEVGAHTQLYLMPNVFQGKQGSEFGSLLRYSVFVGAGYTF
jgi:hypothetical protein